MNAENIAELLMKLSPVKYACDWDNVGMHVGHKDNEINTILVTLDIDDAAIDRAIEINADMIVSHHPLIFHGIKQINDDNITGRRIMRLIENRINAYCMLIMTVSEEWHMQQHRDFQCLKMKFLRKHVTAKE